MHLSRAIVIDHHHLKAYSLPGSTTLITLYTKMGSLVLFYPSLLPPWSDNFSRFSGFLSSFLSNVFVRVYFLFVAFHPVLVSLCTIPFGFPNIIVSAALLRTAAPHFMHLQGESLWSLCFTPLSLFPTTPLSTSLPLPSHFSTSLPICSRLAFSFLLLITPISDFPAAFHLPGLLKIDLLCISRTVIFIS